MRSTVLYVVQHRKCWHGKGWGTDNLCLYEHADEPCRRELIAAQRDLSGDFWITGSDCPVRATEIEVLHTFEISERGQVRSL